MLSDILWCLLSADFYINFFKKYISCLGPGPSSCIRGVPAYTQSTQLRTLIFECPKNKNVLNREKCNKNMPHSG